MCVYTCVCVVCKIWKKRREEKRGEERREENLHEMAAVVIEEHKTCGGGDVRKREISNFLSVQIVSFPNSFINTT